MIVHERNSICPVTTTAVHSVALLAKQLLTVSQWSLFAAKRTYHHLCAQSTAMQCCVRLQPVGYYSEQQLKNTQIVHVSACCMHLCTKLH
jgi:hypothetical protein